MINQRRSIFGVKNPNGCTGHVSERLILIREIVRAERMMEKMVCAWIIRVVTCGHKNHWQAFSVGPGYPVEGRKGSHIERSHDCSNAIDPCIALSRIRSIEFIAAANLLHMLIPQKLVEQNEIVVPRDHEVVFQANVTLTRLWEGRQISGRSAQLQC